MKLYHGRRSAHGCAVDVEEDGECSLLHPRQDLRQSASTDLEWGLSSGDGPAQLALALAADVLGDDRRAMRVYPRLKRTLIGKLPDEGWVLTEAQIRSAIEAIDHERPLTP